MKRLIRPGDVIILRGKRMRQSRMHGKKRVVTDAFYDNGVGFACWDFAWIYPDDCRYVRRSTDKEFIRALLKAQR